MNIKNFTKKMLPLLLCAITLISLPAGCGGNTASESETPLGERVEVRMGIIKGPSGMGASYLMEQDALEESINDYTFSLAGAPAEIVSAMAAGQLDIAAIPTNLAASLYQKISGSVQILALNTGGVLYILEKGDTVQTPADLAGKTIYANGQGANPEYILNYMLTQAGLTVGEDVFVEFRDADELATLAAAGQIDICMLPVPAVNTVLAKNAEMRIALDLTEQWEAAENTGLLTMGCVIVRRSFAQEHPQAIADFLAEYERSIRYINENPGEGAELIAKYEIIPSAAIAQTAIPMANLIFVSGAEEIKQALAGYYDLLFEADPTAIGGALPDDDFYYQK